MKAIRFEVADLGVASKMTQSNVVDVASDPATVSFGATCTTQACQPRAAD